MSMESILSTVDSVKTKYLEIKTEINELIEEYRNALGEMGLLNTTYKN